MELTNKQKAALRFLKQKGVYKEFEFEIKNKKELRHFHYDTLLEILTSREIGNMISDAFLWRESAHEHEYWENINNDYDCFYQTFKFC